MRGVLLVGLRGAGKSTVGPRLAARLGLPFCDVDARIEEEVGRSVGELLAEGSFRELERTTLQQLLAGPAAVVAAGGGAVAWEGLAPAAAAWTVVWLDADTDVLRRRIESDERRRRKRPSLTGAPAHLEIEAVRAERAPRYASVASRRIDTGSLKPDAVVEQIAKLLDDQQHARGPNAD